MGMTIATTKMNGVISREEFGVSESSRHNETAATSAAAREQAAIQARFVMAERHPRNWDTVRVRLLQHCDRPRFADNARYSKPTGKKKINGEWVETFAEGLSVRFAEVARQEMANTESTSSVVFEDDLLRIVRAGVSDIERNTHEFREVAITKVVEKRGMKNKKTGEWEPPEGRETVGNPRLNSYGDPVYLVKATEDEVQSRQNSQISKIQRDSTLRLIPKDIRDECEDRCLAVLEDPNKTDPMELRKRIIDGFAKLGVMPDDLVNYMGNSLDKLGSKGWKELSSLGVAIRDGEISFQDALKKKFTPGDGEEETDEQRQARIQRQLDEQGEIAKRKMAEMKAAATVPTTATPTAKPKATKEQNGAAILALIDENWPEGGNAFATAMSYAFGNGWKDWPKANASDIEEGLRLLKEHIGG